MRASNCKRILVQRFHAKRCSGVYQAVVTYSKAKFHRRPRNTKYRFRCRQVGAVKTAQAKTIRPIPGLIWQGCLMMDGLKYRADAEVVVPVSFGNVVNTKSFGIGNECANTLEPAPALWFGGVVE